MRFWSRLPFIGRLLVTASTALLVAGMTMLFVSARQEASEIREDLRIELSKELETLPAALVETVVVGDFATLQQTLDRYVARPLIVSIRFRDTSGVAIESAEPSPPVDVPAWFLAMFDFSELSGSAPVVVGGRSYGDLELRLNAKPLAGRAWSHLQSHLSILLLAIMIDFLGIWLVLRNGLRPIDRLEEGARALARGEQDIELSPAGSPEFRQVIQTFNAMVHALRDQQTALRLSEERLQLAINGVNDGIWDWDLRSGALYLSPKLKEMVGYRDDELSNSYESFVSLLHPEDKPTVLAATRAYLNGELPAHKLEFRWRHKDGTWRWILGRGEALRDEAGKPYRMAGSHTDITALKALEDELRERMAELSTILDNSSVGITYVRGRRQLWCNQRMAELFGYAQSELQACSTEQFYLDRDSYEALGNEAYPSLGKGERFSREMPMRHRDGHAIWVRVWGKAINPELPSAGTIWVFEDISQQKVNEAELIQAREHAEAANLAKSRFLATMSHEIRTPLNGVLGMAQMLLMPDVSTAERMDYARIILNSGQTLLTLLNDILDLSKIEAGRLTLAQDVFSPEQVLHEIGALFGEVAHEKGLDLQAEWRGTARRYAGDAHRIRQMLSNYVGNAVKFTASGRVRIEAGEVERNGDRAVLEFTVQDTGPGIAEDKLALLFQPFSQADSSTTREFGGTGLGLSIVRSLARLMGGDVGVESTPGAGARFWFRIVVDIEAERADSRRAGLSATRQPEVAWLEIEGRIMVVEDNLTNRKVISALLKKAGLEVVTAEDGQAALNHLAQGARPDLVLMDVQMPVLDGLAATRQIRAQEVAEGLPHLPIVALTAGAFEDDRRQCLAAGMDDFLTKPVAFDALRNVIVKWLASDEQADEEAS